MNWRSSTLNKSHLSGHMASCMHPPCRILPHLHLSNHSDTQPRTQIKVQHSLVQGSFSWNMIAVEIHASLHAPVTDTHPHKMKTEPRTWDLSPTRRSRVQVSELTLHYKLSND
ncbi:hypothetical protein P170DRAFT_164375 [Aspergillus steynii IBT 23096]|uniref:Uncharacterized protein n=1 Tax=Aspergillus steynii IBT 23096 TaxID=1392250 RepID=A0A2I2GER2_9EURO|nr:uncharacterized protein P170DRAFT_164375 [Aspergillus steynii IBT 23096]PLB51341.1 hypothetical protein P170DRAFT_164375 [Aspergillus steynii IBT 23096]